MFFLMFLLPLKTESLPTEDLLTQAGAKLEAKDHAAAEELVRDVLLQQPVHLEASFLLGVVLARQEKWEAAGQALDRTIDLDSRFAPAYLELAGVRYRQGANQEAMRLLRKTISMDPGNSYARYFLATLSYLEDRKLEALYHWNAGGEPRINEIRFATPSQANPELIGKLFRLNEGEVLRRERIMDIRWVGERLGLGSDFQWTLQPSSNGQWDLEISPFPGNSLPSKKMLLLENLPRIAFNQEVFAEHRNDRGQRLGGGARWSSSRKLGMATASFPFLFSGSDVLRLGGAVRDEAWHHTASKTDFILETGTLSGSYEQSFRGRKSLSLHAAYLRQDFLFENGAFPSRNPHVVALGLEWKQLAALNPQDSRRLHWAARLDRIGLFGEIDKDTYRLSASARVNWLLRKKSRTDLALSLQGGISGNALPLGYYFSLGVGPDHPLPLRAHRSLREGRKGNNPLGREVALANLEFSHRLLRWKFFDLKGFAFGDFAFVGRHPFGPSGRNWFHDVGGGLRLSAFGQKMVPGPGLGPQGRVIQSLGGAAHPGFRGAITELELEQERESCLSRKGENQ